MHRRQSAHSLFELIMTLAVAGIVFGLGLPSFGRLAAEQRLRSEADALFRALYRARSESIARRRVVTLCPSRDGEACDDSDDWSAGWMMFVNRDRRDESRRDADDQRLLVHKPAATVEIVANRRAFSLRSTDLRATNGTFRLCDRQSRAPARRLTVSYTGRPRVSREDGRGESVSCAN